MSDPNPFAGPNDSKPRPDGSGLEYVVPLERPPNRGAEFLRLLVELTPHVYITPVLIGLNLLVFVVMAISGVSLFSPAIADLINWGADFGPKTLAGEWWRMLTSMFIHIGIIHVLLNMWVLYSAGPLVERMVGNVGFLLMYLTAGLCGSLASLLWNPLLVSAGASGAIFGIIGCLMGLVARGKGSIPTEILTNLRSSVSSFLVVNVLIGVTVPNVDMAGHLGGLVGGFFCGLVLSHSFTLATRAGRPLKNVLTAALGTVLVMSCSLGVQRWQAGSVIAALELERFGEVERKGIEDFNSALEKAQKGELSDASFGNLLEQEVLPDWRAERERLNALKNVPPRLQSRVTSILEYMRLRQEAWELFLQAAREGGQKRPKRRWRRDKSLTPSRAKYRRGKASSASTQSFGESLEFSTETDSSAASSSSVPSCRASRVSPRLPL